MSNEVYGYFEVPEVTDKAAYLRDLQEKIALGITQIPFSELYNFPEEILPENQDQCVAFIVGDRPGKTNTTYLTDNLDYAPGADIGLPLNGRERLGLLINLFLFLIHESSPSRFVVAITDSSQIEEIKRPNLRDFGRVIYDDFEKNGTPDCIYDVVFD